MMPEEQHAQPPPPDENAPGDVADHRQLVARVTHHGVLLEAIQTDVGALKLKVAQREERRAADIGAFFKEAMLPYLDQIAALSTDVHALSQAVSTDEDTRTKVQLSVQLATAAAGRVEVVWKEMQAAKTLDGRRDAYVDRLISEGEERARREQEREDAAERWRGRVESFLQPLYPLLIGIFLFLIASKANSLGALPSYWFWIMTGGLFLLLVGWAAYRAILRPPSGKKGGSAP